MGFAFKTVADKQAISLKPGRRHNITCTAFLTAPDRADTYFV